MKKAIVLLLILLVSCVAPQTAMGDIYYASPNGSGSICSASAPCSLSGGISKLADGNTLYLQSGVYSGKVTINKSNITISGISGAIIDGGNQDDVIDLNASNVTIDNLLIRNSYNSGVFIEENANNNVIKNTEITNTGIGIAVTGKNNLITNNYIHDLKMIVNDVGGGGNDYGAVGVEIYNGPNEISYNRLINCIAPSYDFGYDGGAVEIYLLYGNADGSTFHNNYAENTDGFIEIHSIDKRFSANNVSISQNTIVSTKTFLDIGLPGYGGGHELTSALIKIDHNTYVDAVARDSSTWYGSVFYFHEVTPTASQIYITNNIVYTVNSWWIASTGNSAGGFTHTGNVYYLNPQRSSLGFTLDPTEKRADPQFVDLAHDDFRLKSTSPAINAGADFGVVTPVTATVVITKTQMPTRTPTKTPTATRTPVIIPTECATFVLHGKPGMICQ